jgi:hypothetical protein
LQKKRIPSTPEELEGSSKEFFAVIKGESDRGCVLVAAAFLAEALEALLLSHMSCEEAAKKSVGEMSGAPCSWVLGPKTSWPR